MKLYEQIERRLTMKLMEWGGRPWKRIKHSHKLNKLRKHRAIRREARRDPEAMPTYRKYAGWEW